jgi:hypothetical protein
MPVGANLAPLCYGLLKSFPIGFGTPHVAGQIVPATEEAFFGAIILESLRHITKLRRLVGMEDARLDDGPAQPTVAHPWTATLVLKAPPFLILQGHIDRHLRDNNRPVASYQLSTHYCDWRFLLLGIRL